MLIDFFRIPVISFLLEFVAYLVFVVLFSLSLIMPTDGWDRKNCF